jgi:hypothetical protein
MTTDEHAEPKLDAAETAGDNISQAKPPRKQRASRADNANPEKVLLVEETPRRLTFKKLEMLEAAWKRWWEAAHGDSEKDYAKAKGEVYTLTAEYLPELCSLARNTLKGRES